MLQIRKDQSDACEIFLQYFKNRKQGIEIQFLFKMAACAVKIF